MKQDNPLPERLIECSECKKPICIRYTEIIGSTITHTSMCGECPELKKRLQLDTSQPFSQESSAEFSLTCPNCNTHLEEVKRGHRLGCSICYQTFSNILLLEIKEAHRLPSNLLHHPLPPSFHTGHIPGEGALTMNLSSRLAALNESLKETLNKEDYEQAASIRDQIKALTEESNLTSQPEKPHD